MDRINRINRIDLTSCAFCDPVSVDGAAVSLNEFDARVDFARSDALAILEHADRRWPPFGARKLDEPGIAPQHRIGCMAGGKHDGF
jgi:hypothetical protein